jgi:hypothetical protein
MSESENNAAQVDSAETETGTFALPTWASTLASNAPGATAFANYPVVGSFGAQGGEASFTVRDNGQVWTFVLRG